MATDSKPMNLATALADRELLRRERDELRAALAEALDGWDGAERAFIEGTNGPLGREHTLANSAELARIAELRAKFLGGK